jgi:hypothetical protein
MKAEIRANQAMAEANLKEIRAFQELLKEEMRVWLNEMPACQEVTET